jgi:hypothetical protein
MFVSLLQIVSDDPDPVSATRVFDDHKQQQQHQHYHQHQRPPPKAAAALIQDAAAERMSRVSSLQRSMESQVYRGGVGDVMCDM